MINRTAGIVAGLALVALTGCNKGGDAPKGQVVATVNGEDITIHELNSELAQQRVPPGVPKKTVEQAVLANVIDRKLVAGVARDRKLDKNPDFILAQRRAEEALLSQALQADIAKKVPLPTREAAEKYMEAHADQFAQRKVYTMDQIQFLRPANVATLGLEKATTMPDVLAILSTNKIDFRRAPTTVDAVNVDPATVTKLQEMLARNPKEVFMFVDQPPGAPAPVVHISQITDTKVVPLTGEQTITGVQQLVQRQNQQKALVDSLTGFRAAAKDKIKYAAGYAPAASKALPAPAAATTKPATPAS